MRTITFRFESSVQADAFAAGVAWVNDSALERDYEVTDIKSLVYIDEDGDEDAEFIYPDTPAA